MSTSSFFPHFKNGFIAFQTKGTTALQTKEKHVSKQKKKECIYTPFVRIAPSFSILFLFPKHRIQDVVAM